MSSVAALVLIASAGGAVQPAEPLTADRAMAYYRMETHVAPDAAPCEGDDRAIVVCGRRSGPAPRLPLPDERPPTRAMPNQKADRAADWNARLGCRMGCDPSKAGGTVSKLIELMKGEDPDG